MFDKLREKRAERKALSAYREFLIQQYAQWYFDGRKGPRPEIWDGFDAADAINRAASLRNDIANMKRQNKFEAWRTEWNTQQS